MAYAAGKVTARIQAVLQRSKTNAYNVFATKLGVFQVAQDSEPGGIYPSSRKHTPFPQNFYNVSGIIAVITALASAVSAWVSLQKQIAIQEQRIDSVKELVLINNTATRESVARLEKAIEAMQQYVYQQQRR